MKYCGNCEKENMVEVLDGSGYIFIINRCPHSGTCELNSYYGWKLKESE